MKDRYTELLDAVEKNTDVRQTLSKIRAMIKEDQEKRDFIQSLSDREYLIFQAMQSEDAKTRKNAALLSGNIADDLSVELQEQCMKHLLSAYTQEDQLFVKSAYLEGLKAFDYRDYLPQLKDRLEQLNQYQPEESETKHISSEMHALEDLILAMGEVPRHVFNGYQVSSELILTCNRAHVETVAQQVKEIPDMNPEQVKTFAAGVLLRSDCIDELMAIRTYHELLFRVPGMEVLPGDVKKASETIAKSGLMEFLEKRHVITDPSQPFIFRIEMKTKMDLAAKSTFVKKLSAGIEQSFGRKLVNNKSNYEFEIRLIETKKGTFNCLVKLYTLVDNRFDYRKASVAASMKPDNAALIVELSKEYMIPDARVLDPFCGVGTLLIERQKIVKANTSYGIDLYGEAIEKAKINTEAAGQIIHFINKDFFEFEHLYLFDEILTDLPFETGHQSSESIRDIYERFFRKAKEHLTGNGRIILYTHNRDYVRQYAGQAGFKILKHQIMLEKAGTDLFILEAN